MNESSRNICTVVIVSLTPLRSDADHTITVYIALLYDTIPIVVKAHQLVNLVTDGVLPTFVLIAEQQQPLTCEGERECGQQNDAIPIFFPDFARFSSTHHVYLHAFNEVSYVQLVKRAVHSTQQPMLGPIGCADGPFGAC
eukprot:3126515-Pyramimonas_sp.AAC.3